MAIIGAQHQAKPSNLPEGSTLPQLQKFLDAAAVELKPAYVELASVTDNRGYYNEVAIAYWPTTELYDRWSSSSGFDAWFESINPESEPCGWFKEIFLPSVDRFETVFSDNVSAEGAAHMRNGVSGEVREHGYWGSMRDRLPVAQTDPVPGERWNSSESKTNGTALPAEKRRIKVPGRQNLAMIRSGQDWSGTVSRERPLYLDTMHPVLIKGMDFLRDQGSEVGCFSCRFMDVIDKRTFTPQDSNNKPIEKTFGLAFFDDLASLEDWSKRHKTHLDIFGRFLQYAKELGGEISLKLFHEVMVLQSQQQRFEYVGCHDKTGMLASQSSI